MTKFGKKRKNTSRKGEKHELKAMWIIKTMLELKFYLKLWDKYQYRLLNNLKVENQILDKGFLKRLLLEGNNLAKCSFESDN